MAQVFFFIPSLSLFCFFCFKISSDPSPRREAGCSGFFFSYFSFFSFLFLLCV
ncbi:hypothetical protein T492DRAFT_984355 [Pavlovales sp. CCMP2436]|nr:hypothetical protein T492DRAFT_984355 [Pavlovales sp. CCMP2436]